MTRQEGGSKMRGIFVVGLCVFLLALVKPVNGDSGNGSGIVFFQTAKLEEIKKFYIERIGCKLWVDQGSCVILRCGNLLVGFCEGKMNEPEAVITFFYESREDVDLLYRKFKTLAVSPPKENKKYRIYHFYARDPEGRAIEFQHFLHPLDWNFEKFSKRSNSG
jgi:hypothetical protein